MVTLPLIYGKGKDNLAKQDLPSINAASPDTNNVIKLKRKVSSLFKTSKPLRPILKKPKISQEDEVRISVDDDDEDDLQHSLLVRFNMISFEFSTKVHPTTIFF